MKQNAPDTSKPAGKLLRSRLGYALAGLLGSAAVLAIVGFASFQMDNAAAAPNTAADKAKTVAAAAASDPKQMLQQYCGACHNDRAKIAGWSVQSLDPDNLDAHNDLWEKILRRVSLGEMPPKSMPRPPAAQTAEFTRWLSTSKS